jgi:hypothetical protein
VPLRKQSSLSACVSFPLLASSAPPCPPIHACEVVSVHRSCLPRRHSCQLPIAMAMHGDTATDATPALKLSSACLYCVYCAREPHLDARDVCVRTPVSN